MSTIVGNPAPALDLDEVIAEVDSVADLTTPARTDPIRPGLPPFVVNALGTKPDREVAAWLGMSTQAITRWRTSRGIRNFRSGGPHPHSPFSVDERDTVATPEAIQAIALEPWE